MSARVHQATWPPKTTHLEEQCIKRLFDRDTVEHPCDAVQEMLAQRRIFFQEQAVGTDNRLRSKFLRRKTICTLAQTLVGRAFTLHSHHFHFLEVKLNLSVVCFACS